MGCLLSRPLQKSVASIILVSYKGRHPNELPEFVGINTVLSNFEKTSFSGSFHFCPSLRKVTLIVLGRLQLAFNRRFQSGGI